VSKLRVFPVYVEDLLADPFVQRLDDAAFGAYMRLLCYAWKEGGLPDDQEQLRVMAKTSHGMAWRRIWGLIEGKWELDRSPMGGQWRVNRKQEEVRSRVNRHRIDQRKRAETRWTKGNPVSPSKNSGNASVSVSVSVSEESKLLSCQAPAPSGPVERVFAFWASKMRHDGATLDAKRRATIRKALKLRGEEDLCRAVTGYSLDKWHMGENDRGKRHDSLELIFRDAEHIERGLGFFREHADVIAPHPAIARIDRQIATRSEPPPEFRALAAAARVRDEDERDCLRRDDSPLEPMSEGDIERRRSELLRQAESRRKP
jgi:uncharacterized protein YdaU (DUF1376 family)